MEKPILKIIGTDGNAFSLLAKAQSTAKKAGMDNDEIKAIIDKAIDGDYDNLLCVLSEYFEIE